MNVLLTQQHFSPPPRAALQTGPAAGFYPAPDGAGQRYWDGRAWASDTAP